MNDVTPLLNQLPESEINKVLYFVYFVSLKAGKLTTIEAAKNALKIIRGMFLYTHFQLTKGK